MRVLVAVTLQPGSVTVTLDDGTTFEVAPEALPRDLPSPGERLDEFQVAALAAAADRKRAARGLLALLNRRLLPMSRLREKLLAKDIPAVAVDAVLAQAEASGLHSDRRFAEAWCRDTLAGRGVGSGYLRAHLRQLGVASAVANAVVEETLPREIEREIAESVARRRWAREPSDGPASLARVVRFLASRGFPIAVCQWAARRAAPVADDPT